MLHATNFKKTAFILILTAGLFVLVYLLNKVFSGSLILLQSFNLGPLIVRYYGLCLALAVLLGYYVAARRAARYGIDFAKAENFLLALVVFSFVGARLYHVLSSFDYYRLHPIDILKVWNGGLSIYGALIGGFFALVFCSKIFNLPAGEAGQKPVSTGSSIRGGSSILNLADWLAPSLVVGQIIGRFGNMFNYELFGYPTRLPWKMFVPEVFRPSDYLGSQFFHPLFLYEVIGNVGILFILLKFIEPKIHSPSTTGPLAATQNQWSSVRDFATPLTRSLKTKTFMRGGSLFIWYVLLYNMLRFFLEFLRIDSVFLAGIRQNAVVSLVLVLVSIIFLWKASQNAEVS